MYRAAVILVSLNISRELVTSQHSDQ